MAKYSGLTILPSLQVILLVLLYPGNYDHTSSSCNAQGPLSGKLTSPIKLGLVRRDSQDGWLKRSVQRSLVRMSNPMSPNGVVAQEARAGSSNISSSSSSSSRLTLSGTGFRLRVSSNGMSSEFVTTMALGTPPVAFTAVVDTGSGLVWRQCAACNNLTYNGDNNNSTTSGSGDGDGDGDGDGTTNDGDGCYAQTDGTPIFDPNSSSTYRTLRCNDTLCTSLQTHETRVVSCGSSFASSSSSNGSQQVNSTIEYAAIAALSAPGSCIYNYVYDDGDAFTSGVFSTDVLTLGGGVMTDNNSNNESSPSIGIPDFAFGCGELDRAPDNFTGAGGVAGLSRAHLSLASQLRLSQFSYCFRSDGSTSPLYLGPAPQSPPPIDGSSNNVICTTPILTNPFHPNLYYVNLTGISIDGQRVPDIPPSAFDFLPDGGGGTIIDSGTTLTFFPYSVYAPTLNALIQFNASMPLADPNPDFDLCYANPGNVGSMTLHFGYGATTTNLTLPPENYFASIDGYGYCLILGLNFGSFSLLGNFLQQNFHVVYDLEALRLSFSAPWEASCGSFV